MCGYDLAHCRTTCCPECGAFFDPAHPRTFLRYPTSGVRAFAFSLVAAALCAVAVAPQLLAEIVQRSSIDTDVADGIIAVVHTMLFLSPIVLLGGMTLASYVCIDSALAILGKKPWCVHMAWFVIAFVIGAVEVAAFFYYSFSAI